MHAPTAGSSRTVNNPQANGKKSLKTSSNQSGAIPKDLAFRTADDTTARAGLRYSWVPWVIAACLLLLLNPSMLPAAHVTLAWEPNNASADAYHVYQRKETEGYNYDAPIRRNNANGSNATSCTIDGLAENVTYYFVVRACSGRDESADSNEVSYRPPSNRTPVARTGGNQKVAAGSHVKLDGTGSYDQDGDALTYYFTQTNGPPVDLTCKEALCTFTAPEIYGRTTALTFELMVGDESGQLDIATTIVLVDPMQNDRFDTGRVDNGSPDGNQGPGLPVMMTPTNGQMKIDMTPWLQASEFHDPEGDTHLLTQWQITETATDTTVMDLVSIHRKLTELQVPQLILEPLTRYTARVRFFDHLGRSSQWSQPVTFTLGEDAGDLNNNRIPEHLEVSAHTDMNNDAIADIHQPNVIKSISINGGQYLAGITTGNNPKNADLVAVAIVDPMALDMAPPPGMALPMGLLNYKIEVPHPGDTVDVTLYLSDPLDPQSAQWTRYDTIHGWRDSSAATVVDTEGFIIERSLQDGGEEDGDGVANGIIIDVFGPLYGPHSNSSLTGPIGGQAAPGSGGGGCFIGSNLL